MDLQWLATDWSRTWASYGYTDAKFDRFQGCSTGGGIGDCTGNRPSEAPKLSYNFGSELTLPLLDGDFFANVNYFWRDEMYSNPSNDPGFINEDFSELSGRIGWTSQSQQWSVYLWGKNLTDNTVQVFNSVSFLGSERAVYNAPRMFGLSLRWNLGGL